MRLLPLSYWCHVSSVGLEPTAFGFAGRRSNSAELRGGEPERSRTFNFSGKNRVLYQLSYEPVRVERFERP